MAEQNKLDDQKKNDAAESVKDTGNGKDDAATKLADESWAVKKPADTPPALAAKDTLPADKIEQGKPYAGDQALRGTLDKLTELNKKNPGEDVSQLKRFESFIGHINEMIKDKNTGVTDNAKKIPEIDKGRFGRVVSVIDKYQANQDALNEALKKNDSQAMDRLLKEQADIKKQMESKEFQDDLKNASKDLNRGFNALRHGLATTYDGLLTTLVDFGRKIPLEQFPQELPTGLKGFAIGNEQFKSLVAQGQLKLPEKTLADGQLPSQDDMKEINKLLRFTDAATQEINRGMLEQQYALAIDKVNRIDSTGELAKKWFPEKAEKLTDEQIEKRLAAATPWIQKGLEVQRYAELHHRFNKMVNEQFNWPSWMGGIPSHWDASAIENNKDVVSVNKDEKTGKINISVKMPDSLDRTDGNTDQIRKMDEWLAKYKGPVDQALGQIDSAKAENSVIYWGDIKADMRVDKDGNMIEKGWKDEKGRQVFQEHDGRKYRFNDEGNKEWVPQNEKLTEGEYRVVNGKTDWVKPGEEIKDVNLMEFRTDAKEVKGPNGEPLIEIQQKQNLQYAHWASYNGWGWVSDVKTMGGDIKAQKLDSDIKIPDDKGVAGGRRDGKKGDYLVTLADGRQQVIDEKSFNTLYRQKEGKPGEYEEKPKTYKPDDWLVVFRTDGGSPQPTLMQAKDVPSFVSSQWKWHWGTKVVTTGVDALMLASGVGEVKAAMIGAEAAAGTAAKLTTMQVLGRALMTRQGLTGVLHAGFGVTGFLGQGIENLGPYGKTFMQARAIAMMADLGYTAIGRPGAAKPFVPSAEQIASQGFFSKALLNFNRVFSETKIGKIQSGGADVFFLSDIGFRQIPGIINRARGVDNQQVQQQAALDRRWPQATQPEDRKIPSSFDKQTMMRIDAFRQPTEDALKLPEQDPKRIELNKKLIDTLNDSKADPRDRLGAAFALVQLNTRDGKLPEKITANDRSIDRNALQDFVDSQRYLQAKEVIDGYAKNLKVHVAADVQTKLDALSEKAKLAMSDKPADRNAAMADLISTFNSQTAGPEEKLMAASALLFARRHGDDGKLAETVSAGNQNVKAKDLVDFLYKSSQPSQGSGAGAKTNPGHIRLYAGDMLLRLDTDRFSMADMNQICLSIVNDKNAPSDPAAKERWTQLKLQAMTDAHGYRLGDLYELMKSRVEPAIANMPTNDQKAIEAKGMALASLLGRDSEAIKATLENLRKDGDARVAGLASYLLYAGDSNKPSERIEALSALQKPGSPLAFPQDFSKDAQNKWAEGADAFIVGKLKADLPGQAGKDFDRASWDKFHAAQQLIAKYPDLKSNPEVQNEINKGLMALITTDNPALAAKALPMLLSRMQSYADVFKTMKPEEMPAAMKAVRDTLFGSGAILDTLKDNSLDMLNDSATYSSYTNRANNLASDLQKLQVEYATKHDKMSESDRAEMESKIAELSHSYANAANAPGELKRALLTNLPAMVKLTRDNPLGAPRDLNLRPILNAVQALCQVQSDRPETASPDLRAQAIATLADLGKGGPGPTDMLSRVLSDDPSPKVRLAALEALNKFAPDDLQKICLKQLAVEQHPEVAKRLREIEYTKRRPDPDTKEYQEKFTKARLDLINQAARSLTGAESYIKSNDDLKFLDGQTLRMQALHDLQDKYFNGVGGFFRFAWDGEKGVDAEHGRLLDKYAGYMRDSMDALGRKAATDDEALKALVYVALSNGRPLLKDDRNWAAEKATEKLKEICANCSADRAKQITWAVENLLLHQPSMSAAGRQNVLDGLKSLIAKPGQAGLTDSQVSTLLATAMQRELRNTPAPGAKDFAAREKLQLDMLNMLNEPRFRTMNVLPVLEAVGYSDQKNNGNTTIESVKKKAQEMVSQLADRSDIMRQQAVLPEGFDAQKVSKKISDELSNPNASSERVGRAIALSEKLGPIKDDNDPRRNVLQVAAHDGHELVRLMAARELANSSNANDRKLAYSVLARLEKVGSRPGYVNEAHELLSKISSIPQLSPGDKSAIDAAKQEAAKLNPADNKPVQRTADVSSALDYQDAFERATRELKENALKKRNLSKYEGPDNWFSKNDNYNLMDADKLSEAQGQAAKDAFPSFIPWLFTSRATIDKRCDDAVKEVWNKQERQLAALGEQAKLAGDAGKEAREALASIILTQGQPFRESDRTWAMHQAAKMIDDCIKNGHPGSRDMMWVVQAGLIEEPSLDPITRFYLMNALDNAKRRGIIDAKEASITMAAALESEYQGMPNKDRDQNGYKMSLDNQTYALSLLGTWGNAEATPVIEALSGYHPDAGVRAYAKTILDLLAPKLPRLRSDAGQSGANGQRADATTPGEGKRVASLFNKMEDHVAYNSLDDQILELQRVRLRLPVGTTADQIRSALQRESADA